MLLRDTQKTLYNTFSSFYRFVYAEITSEDHLKNTNRLCD